MLARSAMIVVFVPDENINLGRRLTAGNVLRETMNGSFKSATETSLLET